MSRFLFDASQGFIKGGFGESSSFTEGNLRCSFVRRRGFGLAQAPFLREGSVWFAGFLLGRNENSPTAGGQLDSQMLGLEYNPAYGKLELGKFGRSEVPFKKAGFFKFHFREQGI